MSKDQTNSSAAISLRRVYFDYGAISVLEDVSFEVAPGEAVSIVGPNGGGKTTLLRLILGLLHPDRGEVRLFGRGPSKTRLRVGYMPQHVYHDFQFPVSVLDVVLMGRLDQAVGRYSKGDRRVALESLDEVGMVGFSRRPFSRLSGGERQRVLIARALACRPDLLLLDEPTANVDSLAESQLHELLAKLSEGRTLVMVTHDLAFVSDMVSKVVCVNHRVAVHPTEEVNGRSIQDLYQRPLRVVRHDESLEPGEGADG